MKRVLVALVCALGLLAAVPAYAGADLSPDVPAATDLAVVVTRQTAAGPVVESVAVDSAREARVVVSGLKRDDDTLAVGMSRTYKLAQSNDTRRDKQWALTTLRAEKTWKSTRGQGVVVAVVDTGVDATHPDLRGRVLKGRNLIAGNTDTRDQNGHGTHVAGVIAATAGNRRGIAGLAPKADILPVRIFDSSGFTDTIYLAKGIKWAINHGAQVINMSLAGYDDDPTVKYWVARAVAANIVVVAAAGNEAANPDPDYTGSELAQCTNGVANYEAYPAAYPAVLGVASIRSDNARSSFSNCGSFIDVAAPGQSIVSTFPDNSYGRLSGTSMAAPYVSAAAALAIQEIGPTYRASKVRELLMSAAKDLGAPGRDAYYGAGLIRPSVFDQQINTRITAKVLATKTAPGDPVTLTGKLVHTNGAALAGRTVTIRLSTRDKVYRETTNSAGRFTHTFALKRDATFTMTFKGDGSSDNSRRTVGYDGVANAD